MINTDNVKLLGALQTIKDECDLHFNCTDCPLRIKGLTETNAEEYVENFKSLCSLKTLNPSVWKFNHKALKKEGKVLLKNAKD